MRLLVTGSRYWNDTESEESAILALKPDVIIEGGAKGADSIAHDLALRQQITLETYAADWGKQGAKAGPLRNARMIDEGKPDFVLAFTPDIRTSRGTRDCVLRALKRRLPVALFDGAVWRVSDGYSLYPLLQGMLDWHGVTTAPLEVN